MLSLDEARRRILEAVTPLPVVTLPFREAAGHVLAADVTSGEDWPPWSNSAMDGFAVRAAEVAGASPDAPVSLRVVGDTPAGHAPSGPVGPGEAVRIMTGAPLPAGADAVVMVEDTAPDGEGRVLVRAGVQPGANVRRAGEIFARGERILTAGTLLRAPEIGVLASLGHTRVPVHRKPVVSLVSSGDELVPPDHAPGPGQIRDSDRYILATHLARLGFEMVDCGNAPDREDMIEATLREAVARSDVVVSTGGVSVGDYDLTRKVLARLGRIDFWRVAVKPGKPLVFGSVEGRPVFGLPGNPVSCLIGLDQFVRPALRKMAGHVKLLRDIWPAVLETGVPHAAGRTEFVRAVIRWEDGRFLARSTGPQGSHSLKSLTLANGLIMVPADTGDLPAGSTVDCQFFREEI